VLDEPLNETDGLYVEMHAEADAGSLYDDVDASQSITPHENIDTPISNDETYADMDVMEPTYDDIPANHISLNNEPTVEILPSGIIHMSTSSVRTPNREQNTQQSNPPNNVVLTGFEPLTHEAPPSYDLLFGKPIEAFSPHPVVQPQPGIHHRPSVNQPVVTLSPAAPPTYRQEVPPVVVPPSVARSSMSPSSSQSNCCVAEVTGNPLKTGIYLFIFLIGVIISLGMLGLGIGMYVTSVNPTGSLDVLIYMIVMGSFGCFFVCWHTTALAVGAYIKHRNEPKRYTIASCCLRVFHVGVVFLIGSTAYLSWLFISNILSASGLTGLRINTSDDDIIPGIALGFLGFQYIMVLYCCCETCIDCLLCTKKRLSNDNDD
jgi:hypothetical protein